MGDPTQEVLYGPMIDERFLERFARLAWTGARSPRRARLDRHRPDRLGQPAPRIRGRSRRGLYCHPTIVDGVRLDDELANTETFGPIVGV